jgi:hypothetical protein
MDFYYRIWFATVRWRSRTRSKELCRRSEWLRASSEDWT